MSGLDPNEWRFKRAKGVIEEYVRGVKKMVSDINWVLRVLKGTFGVSKGEALMIIAQLKMISHSYGILKGLRESKS